MIRINHLLTQQIRSCRPFVSNARLLNKEVMSFEQKRDSPRMKQFHEKLKLQPIPNVESRERFVDLVLVETDSETGELITNSEKEPTKWGDWQNGGRVTDF